MNLKVILSGYNLDSEVIREAKQQLSRALEYVDSSKLRDDIERFLQMDNFTPETLSAAYARISRNPKPIPELREISRREVDKSRRSNKTIIFGLGHASVAEHAVFNFDILGLSRRVVEEIQHFRLASFTEKSQRYIRLKNDFVVPEEIRNSSLLDDYVTLISLQNRAYERYYEKLRPLLFTKHKKLAEAPENKSMIEGWAKEDARYVVSLATESQMGMTVNARTLEHMIARLAASGFSEARNFADELYERTKDLAPSIVKYTQPGKYYLRTPDEFADTLKNMGVETEEKPGGNSPVKIIWARKNGDDRILEAMLVSFSGISSDRAADIAAGLNKTEKKKLFKTVFQNMMSYDGVPRAFERAAAEFELTVSASCFGQLKRHRMSTQLAGKYDPSLGNTIPASLVEAGLKQDFLEIIEQTNELYGKLYKQAGAAAEYILTNSHRRKVFFRANLRELYHFSRLREDEHAQWDIREVAEEIDRQLQEVWPLSAGFLGGKHEFDEIKENFKS